MFTLKKHKVATSSSFSTTSISDLHEDTLVEIICRLPIKKMVSCTCVSKQWHVLINNVCVPRMHGLIFSTCSTPPRFQKGPWSFACIGSSSSDQHLTNISLVESCFGGTLPFRPSPNDFLDCCNGLLLLFDRTSMQYYVWNPSIQQCKTIPNSPKNDVPFIAALIFDPHYKVVHITGPPATMYIFCPATHKWSTHMFDLETSTIISSWSMRHVFFKGSLYRLCMTGYLFKFDAKIGHRVIELPGIVIKRPPVGSLGVSQGSLHYGWDDQSSKMMVWTLKTKNGDTDEWLLKYSIGLQYFDQHPLCSDLYDASLFSVLAFHPTSDKFFVGNPSGIFCYDPDTKRLEVICKLSEDTVIYGRHCLVYPFSPNLTPLDAFSLPIQKIDWKGSKASAMVEGSV